MEPLQPFCIRALQKTIPKQILLLDFKDFEEWDTILYIYHGGFLGPRGPKKSPIIYIEYGIPLFRHRASFKATSKSYAKSYDMKDL